MLGGWPHGSVSKHREDNREKIQYIELNERRTEVFNESLGLCVSMWVSSGVSGFVWLAIYKEISGMLLEENNRCWDAVMDQCSCLLIPQPHANNYIMCFNHLSLPLTLYRALKETQNWKFKISGLDCYWRILMDFLLQEFFFNFYVESQDQ